METEHSFIPSRIIVVSYLFEFQDGTLHCSPTVPLSTIDRVHLKAGDELELRRPDGTVVKTTLHALDWPAPFNGKLGLCLDKLLTKTDIPIGTEVWKIG